MKSNMSAQDKDKSFSPDRGLYDVKMVRKKFVKQLVVFLCNTADEPLCLVKTQNLLDITTETYPYTMLFERIIKTENLTLENVTLEQNQPIGKLDEIVLHEHFNIENDSESYHLRNFEANFDSSVLSKLIVFFKQAKE